MSSADPGCQGRLTGRVAIITGGSRGLGRAIANGLADAGADVVIASRNLESCRAAANEIAQRTGRQPLAIACHVGRWGDLETLVDATYHQFGRLDIVVNNAGMSPLYDSVDQISEELYDKVLAVNLKGPFRLMALAGTRMAAAGSGSIINISSYSSVNPKPHNLPYAAAKAGLENATIGFARVFGPAVRVNCIMAGAFRTDVVNSWDAEAFSERLKDYAMKRIGEPHEVVGAALYFASDASSFTTGAVLAVHGGAS